MSIKIYSHQFKYIYFIIACIIPFQTLSAVNNVNISGFARVVAGYLDEQSAEYDGYDNSLTFKPHSLLGLKAEYRYNDKLSFVAQGVLSNSEVRKSKFDWLYASYTPIENLQLDLGRFRTPLFKYSEVIDVGFTYPWVVLPQTTYVGGLFTSIDGLRATYSLDINQYNFSLSTFAGSFNREIVDRESNLFAESDLLTGINLRINKGDFKIQTSYISSDVIYDIDGLEQILQTITTPSDLALLEQINLNGRIHAYQLSAAYETTDYFVLSETTLIEGVSLAMPRSKSAYVTLGLFHHNFTYFLSASTLKTISKLSSDSPVLNTPTQSVFLQETLKQLALQGSDDNVNVLAAGIRWDIESNIALKAQVDFIDGKRGQGSNFNRISDDNFDRNATLYLISVDWLF